MVALALKLADTFEGWKKFVSTPAAPLSVYSMTPPPEHVSVFVTGSFKLVSVRGQLTTRRLSAMFEHAPPPTAAFALESLNSPRWTPAFVEKLSVITEFGAFTLTETDPPVNASELGPHEVGALLLELPLALPLADIEMLKPLGVSFTFTL